MRITVTAVGSRGDVQPYLALAVGLQQRGHQVRFAANRNFRALAVAYDLDFFPIRLDSFAFTRRPETQTWLTSRSTLKLAINSIRTIRPILPQILEDAVAAAHGADALIYHSFTLPSGYYIGRMLEIPSIAASIYPLPTRAYPAWPLNLPFSLGGTLNLISFLAVNYFTWLNYRQSAREFWKGQIDISHRSPYRLLLEESQPILCTYSPAVLPAPIDLPPTVTLTGYWFLPLPSNWQPPDDLCQFLEEDSTPVYIGFGSMGDPARAHETTELVLEALALSGRRAVLNAGWGELGMGTEPPSNVFAIKEMPHPWLLPQMAAIVHHGGVGTTGAGLRHGLPSIIIPHFGDQYFWGKRIHDLGAGPRPIPRSKLTATKLAEAIDEALLNKSIGRRAAALGEGIRREDGIGTAIKIIETYLNI